jgi:peptidoglycan/LPS O-acetylase OafA/YrhL
MKKQIDSLTGLRFFAALLVVFHHFAPRTLPDFLANIVAHSFVAVTLFFVLSGFILTYNYIDDHGNLTTTKRVFWTARFARIYPVYLLAFFLAAPRVVYHLDFTKSMALETTAAVGYLTLLQSWHPLTFTIWNVPGWSLSAEAFFYLLFPVIAPAVVRMRLPHLWVFAITVWMLSVIAPVSHLLVEGLDPYVMPYNPLFRLPEFILGIVLGKTWMRRGTSRLDSYFPALAVAAAFVLLAFLAMDVPKQFFYNGTIVPLVMILLYSLASSEAGLSKFLSRRSVIALGEASYSLYILHWPIWDISVFVLTRRFGFAEKGFPLFLVTLFCAIFVSLIVFRYLEKPGNRYLKGKKRFLPEPIPDSLAAKGS